MFCSYRDVHVMNSLDPVQVPVSDRGVYVLSEGNGTSPSIALSYFNITDTAFTQNILTQTIGSYPDGLIASGNDLYMTAQGNFGSLGKIYRLDNTGNVQGSNDVGVNPYSLTEASSKLYLTHGPTSSVSVIDKSSLKPNHHHPGWSLSSGDNHIWH